MNAEIADLKHAFALLHDAVEGLVAQGKTAATAGVKPEMQRRSYGGFDEHRLGFATFRDFIRAAEQAGVVRVTHRGPGVTHLAPVDGPLAAPRSAPTSRRIRHDLWEAFFDWHHVPRYWDARDQRVVEEAAPSSGEQRFFLITPISLHQQVDWMRAFANALEDPLAETLRVILDTPRPAQAFSALLRADRHVQVLWSQRRLELVAEHIGGWAAANGLQIPIWQETGVSASGNLRALLHRAIDAIPEDELHLVALPASALIKVSG